MGYYLITLGSALRIAKAKEKDALLALQRATKRGAFESATAADALVILRAKTIDAAMERLGWAIERDGDEIARVFFDGKATGDEETIFRVLAPFVLAGSWIDVGGEEGESWRWLFDGRSLGVTETDETDDDSSAE